MSSKTASGAGEPVIQLITRFCSSSIFLVGRTPPRPTAVEEVEVPVEAVAGVEAEAPKRTPTPLPTPQNHQAPNLMQNDQLCPVGGRLGSFAHLWPLVTSYQFVLQTVTKGYRIEFTDNPPRTTKARCTPIPRNQARRQDLERGLESMLEKRAIREIPLSTNVPGFYSPIFLVAKESGGWCPILNLKAFNKFVKPPPFRMETLRTVMDCLGEAHQQRLNTSEHLRDSSMSETWAVSIDLRDAYLVEHQRDLTLFWVNKLGFLVNEGKSQLIPTQFPAFLGSTCSFFRARRGSSKCRV